LKISDTIKKIKKIKKFNLAYALLGIILLFNISCITPHGALRTYLFIHGHPIIAFISPIKDDELHNRIDIKLRQDENASFYELVIPPNIKVTGTWQQNYIVRKKGIFYIAKYYGEA
jgi:hypothetical protein